MSTEKATPQPGTATTGTPAQTHPEIAYADEMDRLLTTRAYGISLFYWYKMWHEAKIIAELIVKIATMLIPVWLADTAQFPLYTFPALWILCVACLCFMMAMPKGRFTYCPLIFSVVLCLSAAMDLRH